MPNAKVASGQESAQTTRCAKARGARWRRRNENTKGADVRPTRAAPLEPPQLSKESKYNTHARTRYLNK